MKREKLPWLANNPFYTKFAYYVGRKCRATTIKDVAKELKLDWHAVKALEKEYMQEQLRRNPVAAPRAIGIDEISLRKGHLAYHKTLHQKGVHMYRGLVIVDLQNDYFPGGKMELFDIEAAAENARILLNEFRKTKSPIIHIQHISLPPNAFIFLPDTEGAQLNKRVSPGDGETVVVKNYPNNFRDTSLSEILRSMHIDNLVICGAMSHMCIDATTRAAFDIGFNCIVADDACTTMDLFFKNKIIKASEVHASFMAALSFPYAKVVSTKEIIKEMA